MRPVTCVAFLFEELMMTMVTMFITLVMMFMIIVAVMMLHYLSVLLASLQLTW